MSLENRFLDNFNSRPSARGDALDTKQLLTLGQFQFTPLREGRLQESINARLGDNFNSRPSARGDYTPML